MFTESNTVESLIRDALCGGATHHTSAGPGLSRKGAGWVYVAAKHIPRKDDEVWVEPWLREALVRLNPEIAADPDRADEVIYRLRAAVTSVRSDGLVKANEVFLSWLRGDRSMPFGPNGEHVAVRLVDFDDVERNQWVITSQYTFRQGVVERRADLVLLVNGLPLVVIEAKTPTRPAVGWVDGVLQLAEYENDLPELFVPNAMNVAVDGKELRYGAIRAPGTEWGPWNLDANLAAHSPLAGVARSAASLLAPSTLLELIEAFTLFATDRKGRRIKLLCRYQQYEAVKGIVERVRAGAPKKGLIWHFQGSGKSLLMVLAAQKLRMDPALKSPTVLVVVDRIDLDTQISSTFRATDIPNLVQAETREELRTLLKQDSRKVIITTIFRFDGAGLLNERENIIVLVDEAHRTQEGDLGIDMRAALPNAFLFGLTGTPINRRDKNTFRTFGAPEDKSGYLSRYGFEDSVRDGATLPLRFETRLVKLHIDRATLDAEYQKLTGKLAEGDRDALAKVAAKMAVLVKVPDRVATICQDIATHYRAKVEPQGFKAMVVTYDQDCCLLYKAALDKHLPAGSTDVVISVTKDDARFEPYDRTRDEEEALLDRFRDASDPLKVLIVTAKLLTGFDAPILQAMYLDKPLRDHTLLQAVCRTNRRYGDKKTHGLVVDYLGVFDDVATALDFDEKSIGQVVTDLEALKGQFPEALAACVGHFPGVDRSLTGYEGLIAAQDCLPDNERRDAFAADQGVLSRLWEALSPDPFLKQHESDYRWLTEVYVSVQPPSGHGKLLWQSLGAKTIELIHQNVKVDAVRDDLETLVLDADMLDAVIRNGDPREVEIKVLRRLHKHAGNAKYKALGQRLEDLKARHEKGILGSVEFLKELLALARDVVNAEREAPPEEDVDLGKAKLTELFEEVRNKKTPVIVERVVADIDEIVRLVRFPGWQQSSAGEREVKVALRKVLFKYKLHQEQELFDRAYGYIREYY